MKKLLVTLIIVVTAATSLEAQGYRRAGTNTQVRSMYKDELKKAGFNTSQSMTVDALQQDYLLKMRAIKISTTITDAERAEQLVALKAERDEKLKSIISEKQIAQVDKIYSRPNHKVYPPGEPTVKQEVSMEKAQQ